MPSNRYITSEKKILIRTDDFHMCDDRIDMLYLTPFVHLIKRERKTHGIQWVSIKLLVTSIESTYTQRYSSYNRRKHDSTALPQGHCTQSVDQHILDHSCQQTNTTCQKWMPWCLHCPSQFFDPQVSRWSSGPHPYEWVQLHRGPVLCSIQRCIQSTVTRDDSCLLYCTYLLNSEDDNGQRPWYYHLHSYSNRVSLAQKIWLVG